MAFASLQCPLCHPGDSDTTAAASAAAAVALPALRCAKLRLESSARSSGMSAAATGLCPVPGAAGETGTSCCCCCGSSVGPVAGSSGVAAAVGGSRRVIASQYLQGGTVCLTSVLAQVSTIRLKRPSCLNYKTVPVAVFPAQAGLLEQQEHIFTFLLHIHSCLSSAPPRPCVSDGQPSRSCSENSAHCMVTQG
jgi:hypothetical protein